MGASRRRRLGWTIAIAATAAPAAWAADGPPSAPEEAIAYRLECPRLIADGAGPPRHKSGGHGEHLRESAGPDLRLRGRWILDARAGLGGEPFYSLEQQLAYFVAHEPSLVVKLPEALGRAAPPRIELATLEVHLPF